MTVYVDDLQVHPTHRIKPAARRHGNTWCHMATDGDAEELHALADKIGLKREWYQEKHTTPHYDLIPSKRTLAIRAGAVPVTSMDLVDKCSLFLRRRRSEREAQQPRAYTPDEVQTQLLAHVWDLIAYWDNEARATTPREKLEGLAHSILSTLDGSSATLPAFAIIPLPCVEDEAYLREQGENWYPEPGETVRECESDIGGVLHERFFRLRPK